MAEFVQRRVEEQIPELEQLERVGLLTRGEVRSVMKKRTTLEYKLKRRTVEKEDFIGYVQYEINFLELLKKRRQCVGYFYKKEEIELVIVQRIHQIFSRATNKWKEDLQLWMSHIAFCKKWNCKSQLSKIFSSLLAVQADKPALWIMAAKWEFEDQLSAESSRHLFLRALRFHPDSTKVHQEYFRMELMNAEKQRKEKEILEQSKMDVGEAGFSDAILRGDLARAVYKAATQRIKGAGFHLSLFSIAEKFPFTEDLQEEILSDLQTLHAGDPETWDFLARRELSVEVPPLDESSSRQRRAEMAALREERCVGVYEEALKSLHTESMWDLFVSFCLDRHRRQTNSLQLRHQRAERLLSVFRRAHEVALLPQTRYKEWISLLLEAGQRDVAVGVASEATDRFGGSVEMWRMRLEVVMAMKDEDVAKIFEKAMAEVKEKDRPPLWVMMVEWSEERRSAGDTEDLYQKLVLNPSIAPTMKVRYLDWTYRTRGYQQAKRVFSSLRDRAPFSEEFFQKMIDIEKSQEGSRMENLREIYERALREFGSTNADWWLSYMKEELRHPQGKPEKCAAIYWRAMKVLQGEEVERFVTSYTLLQTGHA